MPNRRPILVTLLAIAVLLLAMVNGGRAVVVLMRWPSLNALDLSIPLWLVAVSGILWGIVWLAEGVGLWRLWPPARIAGIILFVLYPINMLAMQAAYTEGAYERGLLPSTAIISAAAAALVAFILTRSGTQTLFKHPVEEPEHDRRPQD